MISVGLNSGDSDLKTSSSPSPSPSSSESSPALAWVFKDPNNPLDCWLPNWANNEPPLVNVGLLNKLPEVKILELFDSVLPKVKLNKGFFSSPFTLSFPNKLPFPKLENKPPDGAVPNNPPDGAFPNKPFFSSFPASLPSLLSSLFSV